MRTSIDLSESQLAALDQLSKAERKSRSALVRQAIDDYIAKRRSARLGDAYGLWGKRKVDGVMYQRRIRRDW
jgi:metal-responsive CopG/Arc/MetJ family transcriptional regulator